MKFTLLTRERADYLVDRYSERRRHAGADAELAADIGLALTGSGPARRPSPRDRPGIVRVRARGRPSRRSPR